MSLSTFVAIHFNLFPLLNTVDENICQGCELTLMMMMRMISRLGLAGTGEAVSNIIITGALVFQTCHLLK